MKVTNFEYWYKATVVSVYDGDSIRVNIDLGFGHWWKGEDGKGVKLRLSGIDTPELRGEERDQGLVVRDKLRELIDGKEIFIKTEKDATGKYGRYLATVVTLDGMDVNEYLLLNGLAKKYE